MQNNFQIAHLQYFGDIFFYFSLMNETNAVFCSGKRYEKTVHANRTRVYGPNGLINLSVPILGGRNYKGLWKDVRIAEHGSWQRIHWRTIHDAYRKAPWFDELGGHVEQLYQQPETFLLDWNLKTMRWVIKTLKLKLDILALEEALLPETEQTQLVELRGDLLPQFPVYQQVFMERFGFHESLSILDLLFCLGPQSAAYLHSISKWGVK